MSVILIILALAIGLAIGADLGWCWAKMDDWRSVERAMNRWRKRGSADADNLLTEIFYELRARRWPWSKI